MLTQLPEQADPVRLCEQGKSFQGRVALREFARLAPLLTSSEGEAAFTLRFDKDEAGRARVRGLVQATLSVCCQRCMQSMPLRVDTAFLLSPVEGPAEAEMLPPEYDPLLLQEQRLHPADLIEDELILAIPPAPCHPVAECGVDLADYREPDQPDGETSVAEDNPFSVLTQLKRDTD